MYQIFSKGSVGFLAILQDSRACVCDFLLNSYTFVVHFLRSGQKRLQYKMSSLDSTQFRVSELLYCLLFSQCVDVLL